MALHVLLNYIDFFAALCGITATYMCSRNNVRHWPITVLTCALNSLIFAWLGMYANSMVQALTCLLSIKGWISWEIGDASHVRWATQNEIGLLFFYALGAFVLCYAVFFMLYKPIIADVISAVFAMVGMYTLGRRWVQAWLIYLCLHSYFLLLMIHSGLLFGVCKFTVNLCIAQSGIRQWAKIASNIQPKLN